MIARFSFVDGNGAELAPSFHVDSSAGASAIQAAMLGKSAAISWLLRVTVVLPGAGAPGSGSTYDSVSDVADLVFADSNTGRQAHLLVPAPLASIFQGDTETVDPSQVGSIVSAVISYGLTPGGEFIDTFLGGSRRKLTFRGFNG